MTPLRARRLLPLLLVALPLTAAAQPGSPARAHEPVVLEGERLPALLGHDPDRIAAFRYDGGWAPVPVQVDERRHYPVALAYRHGDFHPNGECDSDCQEMFDVAYMTYWTDPGTWVGADSTDLAFDADDEVAFMARDAAGRRPDGAADPAGAVAGSRVEVELTAPEGGAPAYVYLFGWAGPPPDAGSYVSFSPVYCQKEMRTPSEACEPIAEGVPYTEHYDVYGRGTGPTGRYVGYLLGANPEDTWVEGSSYRAHFSDRWILDSLSLGDGPDLIDRGKVNGYNLCNRHERTASFARGAHIVNRAGPVRTLRAVLGYNSGPLTQREYVFYDEYIEERTYFR
ncbi:MAG: hypothetical protein R3181_13955, partial [Rubricoccaceae bacterium]|nr:hypothetical protein [Rubricoccaceae bacterium]